MSKNMTFHEMPFALFYSTDMAAVTLRILEAEATCRAAVARFRDDEGKQRMRARLHTAHSGVEKSCEELCSAEAELSLRKTVRQVILDAKESVIPPKAAFQGVNLFILAAMWKMLDEGVDAGLLQSCLTDGSRVEEVKDMARKARRKIRDHAAELSKSRDLLTPAGKAGCAFAAKWAQEMGDAPLLWHMVALHCAEQPEDIDWEQPDTGPLAAEALQPMEDYVTVLRREHAGRLSDFKTLNGRVQMQFAFALDALERALFCGSVAHNLPVAITVVQGLKFRSLFAADEHARTAEESLLAPENEGYMPHCSADPLFWHVAVAHLLTEAGLFANGVLLPAGIRLLADTVAHPKTMSRIPVPRDAERARAALAKWIAPILVGFHPDDDAANLPEGLSPEDTERVMCSFAVHVAQASRRADAPPCFRNERHRKAFIHFWKHLFLPNSEAIVGWMTAGMRRALPMAADIETLSDRRESVESDISEPEVEDVPPPADETFYFVGDPGAAELRPVPVELPGCEREAAFRLFLGERGIGSSVKPDSILHALEFFRDMPPMIRAVRPSETVGGRRWHKLKRGAVRIYVRLEEDGRLLFNFFQRRDWTCPASRRSA